MHALFVRHDVNLNSISTQESQEVQLQCLCSGCSTGKFGGWEHVTIMTCTLLCTLVSSAALHSSTSSTVMPETLHAHVSLIASVAPQIESSHLTFSPI